MNLWCILIILVVLLKAIGILLISWPIVVLICLLLLFAPFVIAGVIAVVTMAGLGLLALLVLIGAGILDGIAKLFGKRRKTQAHKILLNKAYGRLGATKNSESRADWRKYR